LIFFTVLGCFWPSLFETSGQMIQLTTNATSESWGIRHSTTSRGKVLWVDADGSVVLYDGVKTNALQLQGALGAVDDIVFALGGGPTPIP
jgi:hypothetical protein